MQSRESRTASKVKSLGSKTDWNMSKNISMSVFFAYVLTLLNQHLSYFFSLILVISSILFSSSKQSTKLYL